MHLFYSDESNLDAASEFFVYGGLAVPSDHAAGLSAAIETARVKAGISPGDLLKFNPRPPNLTHEAFTSLKEACIRATTEHGCVLLVSVLLHKIAKTPEEARRFEINRCLYFFDCLLNRRSDYGLVLVDRFSDSQIDAQLRERFAIGVKGLPYTDPYRLERILGFHYSCIGQSHFATLIDIVLGSFRYAVNVFSKGGGEKAKATAATLLAMLKPLFLEDSAGSVSPISLHFAPDSVRVPKYRERYEALRAYFKAAGLNPAQEIGES